MMFAPSVKKAKNTPISAHLSFTASETKQGRRSNIKNYMLPVKQDEDYFFITGTRSGLAQQYRWLRIPMDKNGQIDTFMALRQYLKR